MSKKDLIANAFERFGKRFGRRNNKRTLINSILYLEGQEVEGDLAEEQDSGKEGTAADGGAGPGEARVTITRCPDSTGVHLNINGRRFDLPPHETMTVPAWILPTLRNAMGISFTVE